MEKKNGVYLVAIIALAIAVVAMSVGFAFTDIQLNVNGNVTTKATSWDVHFSSVTPGSGSVTPTSAATISADNKTISYTVTLAEPGDKYEFDATVINDGDFDAELTSITMTSTESIPYLNHVVTYDSKDYTAATNNIATADRKTLVAGATETVHVKIEYVQPASELELPTTDQTATYTVTLNYAQKAN